MSIAPSNASWHPAFMPNSTDDSIPAETAPTLQSPTATSELPHEPAKPATDAPSSTHSGHFPDAENREESILYKEPLQSQYAPTTAMFNPGDDKLERNPEYDSIQHPETYNELGGIPTDSPSRAKHLSTMSFARTVSNEVSWGDEDDEVDSGWNLQRTSTDPFKFMAQSDRTNSFPQVPARDFHDESLPHSQAEDILNQVEREPRELFSAEDDNEESQFFSKTSVPQESSRDVLNESQTENSDWFPDYEQAYGGHPREEEGQDEEARFEEGLPLVQHEPLNTNPDHAPFMDEKANGEDDSFAQVNKTEERQEQAPEPHFERKSTMQVISSMHFEQHQHHQQIHGIYEEENMETSRSSLERATGGGIAVSKSTILSEVLGNPEAEIHSQPEVLANLELDSGDGDLAAKWKAALAGDEFLDDDDDELLPDDDEPAEAPAVRSALDPAVLFADDDEGFLEDTDGQDFLGQQTSAPKPVTSSGHVAGFGALGSGQTNRSNSSGSRYVPDGASSNIPAPTNNYTPSAPLLTDLSRSTTAPNGVSPYTSPAIGSFQAPQPPRPDLQPKAQSFANMSKGGYSSPYDLPMEVVKPRKRPSMQVVSNTPAVVSAPPRSSSMFSQTSPTVAPGVPGPPASNHPPLNHPPTGNQPAKVVRKSQSGFFEDLPISSKPKPAPRHASSFTSPSPNPYGPPTNVAPPPPAATTPYGVPPVQQPPVQPPQQIQGLVAPQRVSPYANLPTGSVPAPPVASRYSPAPPPIPQSQTAPPPVAQSRYSPAPPNAARYAAPPIAAPILPHQPRTSSPLAHFERNQDAQPHVLHAQNPSFDRRSSSSGHESTLRASHLPPTREADEYEQPQTPSKSYGDLQLQAPPQPISQPPQSLRPTSSTPPPPQGLSSRHVSSPPKRPTSNYKPSANGASPTFAPPQRSHTQSPGSAHAGSRPAVTVSDPYRRPASVESPVSPRQAGSYSNVTMAPTQNRPRGFSQGMNYVAPTDGRERDPLQRWRGAPVFAWGVGGSIVTSFPKDVPRYGINSSVPSIVRSPGEIKIKNIKDVDPLQPRLASFPGPLKGKTKKKEVVSWLTSGIEILEQNAVYLRSLSILSHDDKRVEERILLWKILRVFIEHDGLLEGSPIVEKAVREVLSPGIDGESAISAPLYATGADLSGISHSSTTATTADPIDPAAVDNLRKHLLRGDREKAVWDAVDKRLWAHALLISNTVSRDLYKRVSQEFVQKEVKIIGENTQSLAALYEIFAGNFEESIDELVPPSARAGFQMVSATNGVGPSKDALDGLDRWRETLGLVLSNRSVDDSQALTALGKLLSGYGRAEAAHICFLFARSHSIFGGIDDPQTSIVLVGSDQLRQPYDFDRELEPVLLSEVFEYGMSLANPTAIAVSTPHLAVYKLQHAKILAEYGFRDKALLYCDAIGSSITSQTRRSLYHHSLLVAELDDLSKRLKQSPKDDSGSWISKPSIDKAKGSVWATFNKFVAGDDNDASGPDSNAGSTNDVGPFARIAGGTPTISRSPSNAEIYGSYNENQGMNGGAIPIPQNKASSRYAPGSTYAPANQEPPQSASSYGSQSRRSIEGRSSSEHQRYEPQRQMSQMSDYRPSSQRSNAPNSYAPQTSSSYTPQSSYTPFGNSGSPYEPASTYSPQTPLTEQASSNLYSSPQSLNNLDGQSPPRANVQSFSREPSGFEPPSPPASNSYQPPSSSYEPESFNSYEPPASSAYEPPSSSGYEPPTGSYEPPAYEPATMNDEPDSPIDTRPKKKSFMDDNDDDIPALKAASDAPREKTKAEKDREADEAFRRAAEADAQKAKETAPAKKGWGLGGWFGGSKKEADMSAQPNKPIRAKLGEASSFVYDPELKRWVNKKAGAEQTEAKGVTPPPPRASGPPRTASVPPPSTTSMMTPPLPGPTSSPRAVSGPPMATPPMVSQRAVSENVTSTSTPILGDSPAEGLGLSLAPPLMSRSASNGSGPPSRPGTSMSNASSIDDLLGPPAPRKGGAAAKKKKGRGYIDVMGEK